MTHRPASLRIFVFAALIASVLPMNGGPVRDAPSLSLIGPASVRGADVPYVPGQILVKFKSDVPAAYRAATLVLNDSRAVGWISTLDVYTVQISADASVEEKAAAFAGDPGVLFAEPNYVCRAAATPNDNLFKYQYALSNTGQRIGDVPGSPQGKISADIKACQGWEESPGDDSVTIAIIDSGVDLTHPDLVNKITGPGRDFVNDDFDATDDFYHGTAVAGIAAADTNNTEGIAGVAWNAGILPVKVLNADGAGTAARVSEGIIWAAEQGARIINLSLEFDAASQTLLDAVRYAFNRGCILVASAGNDNGAVKFPAAFDAYVLAVAATDYNDEVWASSNSGPEVDVAAPGLDVLTTVPTWFFGGGALPYGYVDGTSMAAPHVSGLAAILKSQKPWLSAAEIMEIIRFSADDVNGATSPGIDESIGYGRINMEKALVPLKLERTFRKIGPSE
ncbi:MAG: S8 family serine peptidase [Candidatus Aminicenantes bacterium]|nr:S8 family serine peptidase [Candidatus Aminicenantes bacterium]